MSQSQWQAAIEKPLIVRSASEWLQLEQIMLNMEYDQEYWMYKNCLPPTNVKKADLYASEWQDQA